MSGLSPIPVVLMHCPEEQSLATERTRLRGSALRAGWWAWRAAAPTWPALASCSTWRAPQRYPRSWRRLPQASRASNHAPAVAVACSSSRPSPAAASRSTGRNAHHRSARGTSHDATHEAAQSPSCLRPSLVHRQPRHQALRADRSAAEAPAKSPLDGHGSPSAEPEPHPASAGPPLTPWQLDATALPHWPQIPIELRYHRGCLTPAISCLGACRTPAVRARQHLRRRSGHPTNLHRTRPRCCCAGRASKVSIVLDATSGLPSIQGERHVGGMVMSAPYWL
jgi:hypothetical protein